VRLDLDVATSLGIIITELVSNAYMHAFAGPGELRVTLSVAPPGGAVLSVIDNGVGFTEVTGTKRRGVGLVRRLVEQVGATLSLRSDQGTAWTIGFTLPEPSPERAV
jgi:two-component sensor histidine kinase